MDNGTSYSAALGPIRDVSRTDFAGVAILFPSAAEQAALKVPLVLLD
jgi:hypothetical protein